MAGGLGRTGAWSVLGAVIGCVSATMVSSTVSTVRAAAVITVTTTADELNADGDCSLREAVRAANLDVVVDRCAAGAGSDTISVPAGTYTLTIAGASEDQDATGDLDIRSDVAVIGAGAGVTIIDGGRLDRVFDVVTDSTAAFQDLTISGGTAPDRPSAAANGGSGLLVEAGSTTLTGVQVAGNVAKESLNGGVGAGVANYATTRIVRSTISANVGRPAVRGGGVWNAGEMTIVDSTIADNAAFVGGGIANGGHLTVTGSTISGNRTAEQSYESPGAGGLENLGSAELTNVTVSGNTAAVSSRGTAHGAGIRSSGSLTMDSSTVTANVNTLDDTYCSGDGCFVGADAGIDGSATLHATIVSGNSVSRYSRATTETTILPADCADGVILAGYDLIGSTCVATVAPGSAANILDDAPGLGPLADNGGPVLTHGLLDGSSALDAGEPSASPATGACPLFDARGVTRPQAATATSTPRCDVGAYERTGSVENLLTNGSFEAGAGDVAPWIFRHDVAAALSSDTSTHVDGAASVKVSVAATSTSTWLVQLRQEGLALRVGVTYTVGFWVKASGSRLINARLQSPVAPYPTLVESNVAAGTSWQHHQFTYTAARNAANVFVGFNLAQAVGDVWLDGVTVTDGNLLRDGGFESGGPMTAPWVWRNDIEATATIDTTDASTGAASAQIVVPTKGAGDWYAQLRQPIAPVFAHHHYRISFDAKGSRATLVDVRLQSGATPYATDVISYFHTAATWTHSSFVWTPRTDVPQPFVGFNLGGDTGTVWIDDVRLIEVPGAT